MTQHNNKDEVVFKDFATKYRYLTYLANKYGNYELQVLSKKYISKRRSIYELIDNEQTQYMKEFVNNCNQRTILESEIVFDFDDGTKTEILNTAKNVIKHLQVRYYGLFEANKGYHLHVIYPPLALATKFERERYRKLWLNIIGADPLLASETHMIALEYETHWKSGKLKQLILGNWIGGGIHE